MNYTRISTHTLNAFAMKQYMLAIHVLFVCLLLSTQYPKYYFILVYSMHTFNYLSSQLIQCKRRKKTQNTTRDVLFVNVYTAFTYIEHVAKDSNAKLKIMLVERCGSMINLRQQRGAATEIAIKAMWTKKINDEKKCGDATEIHSSIQALFM